MQNGKETGESYLELPVSNERYKELFCNLSDTTSKAYGEVKKALEIIAKLQGYKLIGLNPEFTFETKGTTED